MRMTYQLAIFDFDGTLADSFPFAAGIINEVARKHGFRTVDAAEIPALRQLGARQLMAHLGLSAWKLPFVSRTFIGMMRERAASIPLFPGAREMLHLLAARRMPMAVVSSNSEDNIRLVLGESTAGLMSQFECGASVLGKASRLRRVVRKAGLPAERCIYIADHTADAEGARDAGVHFGAVSWGYSPIESLRGHHPHREFASMGDIVAIAGQGHGSAG